ncbi:hypothetical protein AOLI_G00134860 [Acnodon oligacanthus]
MLVYSLKQCECFSQGSLLEEYQTSVAWRPPNPGRSPTHPPPTLLCRTHPLRASGTNFRDTTLDCLGPVKKEGYREDLWGGKKKLGWTRSIKPPAGQSSSCRQKESRATLGYF